MNYIQIAIDGPAGAGKSTIAKEIAERLDITYIDTGAMYRALTYKALVENVNVHNKNEMIFLAKKSDIKFYKNNIYLDNDIINREIRDINVSKNVSYVAQIPEVRKILVDIQRKIATYQDVIMDGRDIGTHVLPNATIKIFLTASVEERAYRRYIEFKSKGTVVDLHEIKKDIMYRDKIDSERTAAPLIRAEDATIIDTTGLLIEEVVEKIINL